MTNILLLREKLDRARQTLAEIKTEPDEDKRIRQGVRLYEHLDSLKDEINTVRDYELEGQFQELALDLLRNVFNIKDTTPEGFPHG